MLVSTKRCNDAGIPEICQNNAWSALSACSSTQVCKDGDCVDKAPAESGTTEKDLSCNGVDDMAAVCREVKGETWAYSCFEDDGVVIYEEWGQGNCTKLGMPCFENEEYMVAWCGCNENSDCHLAGKTVCNKETNHCEECVTDSDCKNGKTCDGSFSCK